MPLANPLEDLVEMLRHRRVIPFVGAGFSVALGLPTWETLLEKMSQELRLETPFAELVQLCNKDFLQIAEYMYLASDRSIGPLRHVMSRELSLANNTLASGSHTDLVNLGAAQVYTTNYDDAVEATYLHLVEPVSVVALPKHVANSDSQRTQVVKFHGDLRHDQTLVLTESSYYARLDFESPMDLKFRSDILGKSVLFMGYGFADINIRIIWFKLMRMMKDIRPEDRPKSYMVTFAANPVREVLYEEVGIRTIVLPTDTPHSPESRTKALAHFLNDLALRCADNGRIPGTERPQFVSKTLLDRLNASIPTPGRSRIAFRSSITFAPMIDLMREVALRRVPPELLEDLKSLLPRLLQWTVSPGHAADYAQFAVRVLKLIGPHPDLTGMIVLSLARAGGREVLFSAGKSFDWADVWDGSLSQEAATRLFSIATQEIRGHAEQQRDADLAYIAAAVARIIRGDIEVEGTVKAEATNIFDAITSMYPVANQLLKRSTMDNPNADARVLIDAFEAAENAESDSGVTPNDDIPF